tara:strand:+ start:43193 stop:43555 length:363 start_codon:yes stop_codon:yes gene_type:complete
MSEEKDSIEIQTSVNADGLYREESYTDLEAGGIKAFFPVDEKGVDVVDGSRDPVFIAMTTIQDPTGQSFPIQANLEAKHLSEACEQFKPALDEVIKDMVAQARELQAQEQASEESSEEAE